MLIANLHSIRNLNVTLSLMLFAMPAISHALEELAVVGTVEPARPYYEKFIMKSKDEATNTATLEPVDQARIDEWSAKHSYYDSGMVAGIFEPIPITDNQIRIVQNMCFIANDDVSINWLDAHRAGLEKINPICYLTRTTANNDLGVLQKQYPSIMFVAVNPKFIAKTYQIPHYPALLSKEGIEQ